MMADFGSAPQTARPSADAPAGSFVTRFLRLIRFSHTLFALPFALAALVASARGWPSRRVLLLVVACMVCARTAAMLFNRIVDWSLDQRNPRTVSRHSLLPKTAVVAALLVSSVLFLVFAAAINPLTRLLAPVALAVVFFYSFTKRFTAATHFFLGLALGITPIAAWIAQTGKIALAPVVLAFAVVCWVAGFDLIYATQDYEFDRRERLHSLVVTLGIPRSLHLAQFLHVIVFAALLVFGWCAALGMIYFAGMPLIAAALVYEHRAARRLDLLAINRAFFHTNAFVSAVFLAAVCADRLT